MSTFDTLCDWREGMVSDTEALQICLMNLAEWCPAAAEQEAFDGLCEIALSMRKREDAEYEAEYRKGTSTRFLVHPRFPPPTTIFRAYASFSDSSPASAFWEPSKHT